MILRDRQQTFVHRCQAALDAYGNTLGVAPTGAGKTVMLSATLGTMEDAHEARTLVLQHRSELVAQNRRTWHAFNGPRPKSGQIDATTKEFRPQALFAMTQTLGQDANLARLGTVDRLACDEAHHYAAPSYRKVIDHVRARNPHVQILGVTATPNRGDKKALKDTWTNVADQIGLGELIQAGALVKPRTFVIDVGTQRELREVRKTATDFDMAEVAKIMDKAVVREKVVEKWKELAGDRSTVVFCSTVEHADHTAEAFRHAGVAARVVTGDMGAADRTATLAAFDRGDFQVIVNVAVLTEGWDCQHVGCVILLRPSSYQSTMVQMVGRGLRRMDPEQYPGWAPKTDCIVLDFGTSILTHGTLEQDVQLDPEKGAAPAKTCPECAAILPNTARECAICGHQFPAEDPEEGEGGGGGDKAALDKFAMTEVDLFAASPFRWEELWDGVVLVATAFEAWAVVVWYGGHWHAIGGDQARGVRLLASDDKMLCLAMADDFMREQANPADSGKAKRWLHQPATEKQAQHLGVPGYGLTRYAAACHLTWKFNERAIRAKLQQVAARAA